MRLVSVSLVSLLLLAAGAAWADPPDWGHDLWLGRSRIGVQVQSMTPELREFMEAPRDRGVLVVRVLPDSPAEKAGLAVGDVITRAGDQTVEQTFDLVRAVAAAPEGTTVELQLHRKGESQALTVRPEGSAIPWAGPEAWEDFGRQWRRGMRDGAEMLRQRLEQLEKRLEELERREKDREDSVAT